MKKRVTIPKLREMDDTMLQVVTSDVLTMLMDIVDPGTMCDLLAIAETPLPPPLAADMTAFAEQMHRDMADLPRGPVLAAYLKDLGEVDPSRVPESFRAAVFLKEEDCSATPATQGAYDSLCEVWHDTPFDPVDREGAFRTMRVQMPDVPERLKLPEERVATKARATKATAGRSAAAKKPAAPSRDPERDLWLRKDIVERLGQYEGRGLKQSVLVAGTIRRSSLSNTTKSEVMAMMRVLKREGVVRESAGRWILKGRW